MGNLSLSTLVYEDNKLIEDEIEALVEKGIPYEQAVEQAVMKIDALTADKALSYARLIVNLESQADAIKAAALKQSARVKHKEGVAMRLKLRLLELLPQDFKAEADDITLRFQRNAPSLDDSKLPSAEKLREERPDLFREVPASFELDKKGALDLLKAGEEIPGLSIRRTYSVRISQ